MRDAASFCPVHVTPLREGASTWEVLRTVARNPCEVWPESLYHGRTMTRRFLGRNIHHIADPDMVRDVLLTHQAIFPKSEIEQMVLERATGLGLLTTEGAQWETQRKAVAPVFRHQTLMALAPAMIAAGEGAAARLATAPAGAMCCPRCRAPRSRSSRARCCRGTRRRSTSRRSPPTSTS
ncbi:MAG: hypothetical protein ACU0DW_09710 [Shimia sp.]